MILTEVAPAKVNLFLHVGPVGSNGRHPLCSLVVLSDIRDTLRVEASQAFQLGVDGPFADQAGSNADNLVTRALALAGSPPMFVSLTKMLPAAAGLGGGTSDAGAALRLAGRLFGSVSGEVQEAAARALGADGLMCLRATSCLAEGEGERLTSAPAMPSLPAVLVNPGVPSPTGDVYRAYDQGRGRFTTDRPTLPRAFTSVGEIAAFLDQQRNDLEAPAIALAPEIALAIAALMAQGDVRLTRMSGSGATVFGLFETPAAAASAAARIQRAYPDWWVQSCHLNTPARMAH